jgi:hypothetical protein
MYIIIDIVKEISRLRRSLLRNGRGKQTKMNHDFQFFFFLLSFSILSSTCTEIAFFLLSYYQCLLRPSLCRNLDQAIGLNWRIYHSCAARAKISLEAADE